MVATDHDGHYQEHIWGLDGLDQKDDDFSASSWGEVVPIGNTVVEYDYLKKHDNVGWTM